MVTSGVPALAQCPPTAKIKADIERLTRKNAEVLSLGPSPVAPLCEVVVKSEGQNKIFYVDPSGSRFVFGTVVDAATGANLSQQRLDAFNTVATPDMEKLAGLTAFSIGNDSAPLLYYVTDPQCPYCKRGEEDLKILAAEGKITVRFLLFPLPSHPGALEQCIAVVCDGKGLEELESGYRSANQCEQGRRLVAAGVDLLKRNGIHSTPTYIFGDGRFHSGVVEMTELLKRVALAK
jgi:thiol:disulfide interchange protein DsbC